MILKIHLAKLTKRSLCIKNQNLTKNQQIPILTTIHITIYGKYLSIETPALGIKTA
jgi:hypothetical protein